MPKRNFIWILAIAATALIAVWAGRSCDRQGEQADSELDGVAGAYELIQQRFFHEVEEKELLRAAVQGMIDALDPFSTYMPYPPGKLERFRARVMGRGRGLGIHAEVRDGTVRVTRVDANSPAYRKRVRPGDRIVAIDGRALGDPTARKVNRLLVGPTGTAVELTLLPVSGGPQRTVRLQRRDYPLETVRGLYRDREGRWVHTIDPEAGAAYVRVTEFVRATAGDVKKTLRRQEALRGLVLDLRGNPGGLLDSAIDLTDLFLRQGQIARVLSRGETVRRPEAAAEGTPYDKLPLVILIDAETASGAEIVAGALAYHARALLVGTRTRGKGYVQSMLPLPGDLGLLNLTTAEFLVGPDRPITRRPGSDRWGIDPSGRETLLPPEGEEQLRGLYREAGTPPPDPATATRPASPRSKLCEQILRVDTQLARAVRLLRSPERMDELLAEARRAAQTRREDD